MFYAKVENDAVIEWPIYSDNLRVRFPNVSFPSGIFDPPEGYVLVEPCETPQTDHTKNVVEVAPTLKKGTWTQTFKVAPASSEEISQRIALAWDGIRMQRNQLLAKCDWTQLADAPVDTVAWSEYRQALRDITEQANPFDIEWPIAPQ